MLVLDASSIIHAWDNYPINQFPGLWSWIASQIEDGILVIPVVALDEVGFKIPECKTWLVDCEIQELEMTNASLLDAMRIKKLLNIVGDGYHSKGVDENDLFIIVTARAQGAELISNEGRQQNPVVAAKSKIPAVCAMNTVSVPCINFIEYIKRSEKVFQ